MWTKVTDGLPEDGKAVVSYNKVGLLHIDMLMDGKWKSEELMTMLDTFHFQDVTVTHWMKVEEPGEY